MELLTFKSPEDASKAAAKEVADLLKANPIAILALTAGKSFDDFYKEVIRYHTEEGVSMHKFRSFQTTEYLGLPGTHPMSNRFYLVETFFEHIPSPRRYQKRLPGLPINMEGTIAKFEQRIKSVDGIDLLVIGLGKNGQLGFNERGTSFDSITHQVLLAEEVREEYAKGFPRGVIPRRGITMGISTILSARKIIVLVSEPEKADALEKTFTGRMGPAIPSTALRKHPNVVVYADKKIAVGLPASVS